MLSGQSLSGSGRAWVVRIGRDHGIAGRWQRLVARSPRTYPLRSTVDPGIAPLDRAHCGSLGHSCLAFGPRLGRNPRRQTGLGSSRRRDCHSLADHGHRPLWCRPRMGERLVFAQSIMTRLPPRWQGCPAFFRQPHLLPRLGTFSLLRYLCSPHSLKFCIKHLRRSRPSWPPVERIAEVRQIAAPENPPLVENEMTTASHRPPHRGQEADRSVAVSAHAPRGPAVASEAELDMRTATTRAAHRCGPLTFIIANEVEGVCFQASRWTFHLGPLKSLRPVLRRVKQPA